MKKDSRRLHAPGQHWVGDGFPVRTLFAYNSHGGDMSPFLLLDYAGPGIHADHRAGAVWASIRTAVSRR